MFRITVVVENTVAMPFKAGIKSGLLGEHGLALLIEHQQEVWLYDTGRGRALLPNLTTLGITPDEIAGLILSHAHLDHFGSLMALLEKRSKPLPIYAHPDIFSRRFTKIGDELREVGIPWTKEALEAEGGVFHLHRDEAFLRPNMWISGEIPRENSFETTGENFLIERKSGLEEDLIPDDQALVLVGEKGLLVLTGCAHAGICNILTKVKACLPGKPLYGVMGGLHLVNAGVHRLARTGEVLKKEKITLLAVGHCTGFRESWQLAGLTGKDLEQLNTGAMFRFA